MLRTDHAAGTAKHGRWRIAKSAYRTNQDYSKHLAGDSVAPKSRVAAFTHEAA